jgi:hypothetical protein
LGEEPPAPTVAALKMRREIDSREDFLRAYCNVWVDAASSWLPVGAWTAARWADAAPEPEWWIVEASPAEGRYVVVAAGTVDGKVVVDVVATFRSELELWQFLAESTPARVRLAVGVSMVPRVPLTLQRRTTPIGKRETDAQSAATAAAIVEGRLFHTGDPIMEEQVARIATYRTTRGDAAIRTAPNLGPVELARCVVFAWAVAGAVRPAASRPMVAVARR